MTLEMLHMPAESAAAKRPPILFVHGSYWSAHIWTAHFFPYFSAKGFACNAVSLRGHGDSDGMLGWTSLADYGEDVAEAMRQIGEKPILIGHSVGGLVVQHALAAHEVAAAVLVAAVPPSGISSSAMHLSMFAPDILWQLGLLQSLGTEAVSTEVMARAFLGPNAGAEAKELLMSHLQRESPRVAADLLAPPQPSPPAGRPPILVLGGDADMFLPTSAFRETATYFGADLKILKGAPHALMLDEQWWQPAADEIIRWLARRSV
jgi:pimeloyl-ACP methyl ester carboxylesterase